MLETILALAIIFMTYCKKYHETERYVSLKNAFIFLNNLLIAIHIEQRINTGNHIFIYCKVNFDKNIN